MTKEEFIIKAKLIHGNRYDYSLVVYKNNKTKVKIICPIHGVFEQYPCNHINKKTICSKCSYENRLLDNNIYIKQAKKIHGDKYDYSKTSYEKSIKKVIITCKIHGDFEQLPHHHLQGQGCLKCKINDSKITFEYFINKSNKLHNYKYDYCLVNFENNQSYIDIICPIHGIFNQRLNSHLGGCGCPKCFYEKNGIKKRTNYNLLSEYRKYRLKVLLFTKKLKSQLLENWDGYDFYDSEDIRDNFNLPNSHKDYPTVDHKKSVHYCFTNDIPIDECADITNLCLTKRWINSSKGKRITYKH